MLDDCKISISHDGAVRGLVEHCAYSGVYGNSDGNERKGGNYVDREYLFQNEKEMKFSPRRRWWYYFRYRILKLLIQQNKLKLD